MPSHVEATLIRMRSFEMPLALYSYAFVSSILWQLVLKTATYVDDVQCLLNGLLSIEGEASVDLC